MTHLRTCYQCNKQVNWLASDSRCYRCTRMSVEQITGEVETTDDDYKPLPGYEQRTDWQGLCLDCGRYVPPTATHCANCEIDGCTDDYKPLPGKPCGQCGVPFEDGRCPCCESEFECIKHQIIDCATCARNKNDSQLAQQVVRPEVSNTGLLSHFETGEAR